MRPRTKRGNVPPPRKREGTISPAVGVLICSKELGLASGGLSELQETVRRFSREPLVMRTLWVLNALATGGEGSYTNVTNSLLSILPEDLRSRIASATSGGKSTFLEPLQQLLVLKHALALPTEWNGSAAFMTEEGERSYVDVCRFASDVLRPPDPFADAGNAGDPDAWVKIAADMMPRLALVNQLNVAAWIARFDIMFREMPLRDEQVAARVAALRARFSQVLDGLTFDEVTTLVQFLSLWVVGLEFVDLFKDPSAIQIDAATWLTNTDLPIDALVRLLKRAGRDMASPLVLDNDITASLIAFRDRPFLTFPNGTAAPVFPGFVLEKLTPDIFWWLKDVDIDQSRLWQNDWGYVAESYVLQVLNRVADAANCDFEGRIKIEGAEVDAAMWANRHVAVFEITTSSLRETEETSANWKTVRDGLLRAFVENPKGKKGPHPEAVTQLVRDVSLVLDGKLEMLGRPNKISRVYPVMIATDRRARTPGVVNFLQAEFQKMLPSAVQSRCAALAVLGLEDVEDAEALTLARLGLRIGQVRGLLQMLRKWDVDRGPGPSWWQFTEAVIGHPPANPVIKSTFRRWSAAVDGKFNHIRGPRG